MAVKTLRRALRSLALALPDIHKAFHLYVDQRKEIAKGVHTQTLGPWKRPVAYLSKKLNLVAQGWPDCLWIIAATALLANEADRLTLGQELFLTTPHSVETLLRGALERWICNAQVTQYQALLPDQLSFSSIRHQPSTLPVSCHMMTSHVPCMTDCRENY